MATVPDAAFPSDAPAPGDAPSFDPGETRDEAGLDEPGLYETDLGGDEDRLGAPDLSGLGEPIYDSAQGSEASQVDAPSSEDINEADTYVERPLNPLVASTGQAAEEAQATAEGRPTSEPEAEVQAEPEVEPEPEHEFEILAETSKPDTPAHTFDFKVTQAPPRSIGEIAPVPKDSQETMDPEERESMLFEALPMFMELAQAKAKFWDFVWDSIDHNEMTSRAALRGFPTTPLSALFEAQDANPPFGGLTTTPTSDLKQILASVSGASIAVGRFGDWANAAPALYAAGVTDKHILLNAYSFDGGTHGAMMQAAALSLGTTPIAVGDVDVPRLLKTVIEFDVDVFVGPAEALIAMLETAQAQGITALPLRIAVVDQANSQIPEALKMAYPRITITGTMMDEFFGMIAYQPAGEAPFVCSERMIIEICDPATGDQVNTGEIGELVVTRLDKHTPLFRIATGVLTRELQDASPSQRSNTKIQGWMGAKNEVLFFEDGSALHGAQVLALLEALPQAEAGLIQIDDVQGVTLNLVAKPESDEDKLVSDGNRELHIFTGLEGQTIIRPQGSISPYGPLIVDRRGA